MGLKCRNGSGCGQAALVANWPLQLKFNLRPDSLNLISLHSKYEHRTHNPLSTRARRSTFSLENQSADKKPARHCLPLGNRGSQGLVNVIRECTRTALIELNEWHHSMPMIMALEVSATLLIVPSVPKSGTFR